MRYIQRLCVGALKECFCTIRNVYLDHRLYNNLSSLSLSVAFLMPEGARRGGGEDTEKLTYTWSYAYKKDMDKICKFFCFKWIFLYIKNYFPTFLVS